MLIEPMDMQETKSIRGYVSQPDALAANWL